MRYWILAAVSALSSFAIWSAIGSAAVGAMSGRLASGLRPYSPASRAALLFKLRLTPSALGAVMGAFSVAQVLGEA